MEKQLMALDFIPADEVHSPRRQWTLIAVLQDEKEPTTCVLAVGRCENKPVLAMRWNGSKDSPIGNPQSRGLPTWFIVGSEFNECLMNTLPADKKALVKAILQKA